jgi:hypothetical protein
LNDLTKTKVCRDDLDRNLLAYFLQHEGATIKGKRGAWWLVNIEKLV